jgi:hypothetical protein
VCVCGCGCACFVTDPAPAQLTICDLSGSCRIMECLFMNTFLIHDVAVLGIHDFFLLFLFKILCSQNVGGTVLHLTIEFLLP